MRFADLLDQVERRRATAAERPVHDARSASLLGVALGVAFAVCFLTGVWSHLQQDTPTWLRLPLGPTGLYRFTQGLHVMSGLASIPLLLGKLFAVSPHLLRRPAVRGAADGLERFGLLLLVGGSVFLLATGAMNITGWYPWDFGFRVGHWWAAWLVLGAVAIHVALKARVLTDSLGRRMLAGDETVPGVGEPRRRALLGAVAAASGLVTLLTAGQTVPYLRPLALLAPRRPDIGPQGLPVNRTARAAGTVGLDGPDYRLVVQGPRGERLSFTLDELRSLPQRSAALPIACVEGWSASARWTGVSVADLLRHAGLPTAAVTVRSAQRAGAFRSSELSEHAVRDPRCLLALLVDGEPLAPDHGAPLRLIAPNRPGVHQTKWVTRLEVS